MFINGVDLRALDIDTVDYGTDSGRNFTWECCKQLVMHEKVLSSGIYSFFKGGLSETFYKHLNNFVNSIYNSTLVMCDWEMFYDLVRTKVEDRLFYRYGEKKYDFRKSNFVTYVRNTTANEICRINSKYKRVSHFEDLNKESRCFEMGSFTNSESLVNFCTFCNIKGLEVDLELLKVNLNMGNITSVVLSYLWLLYEHRI